MGCCSPTLLINIQVYYIEGINNLNFKAYNCDDFKNILNKAKETNSSISTLLESSYSIESKEQAERNFPSYDVFFVEYLKKLKEDYKDFTFFSFALLVSNKKSLSEIEETLLKDYLNSLLLEFEKSNKNKSNDFLYKALFNILSTIITLPTKVVFSLSIEEKKDALQETLKSDCSEKNIEAFINKKISLFSKDKINKFNYDDIKNELFNIILYSKIEYIINDFNSIS